MANLVYYVVDELVEEFQKCAAAGGASWLDEHAEQPIFNRHYEKIIILNCSAAVYLMCACSTLSRQACSEHK
jgi:hypothetical protein